MWGKAKELLLKLVQIFPAQEQLLGVGTEVMLGLTLKMVMMPKPFIDYCIKEFEQIHKIHYFLDTNYCCI